jgi:hypothetical protein
MALDDRPQPARRRCLIALAGVALLPLVAARAHAHAILVSSIPEASALVPAGALAVRLTYNSRIDALRSRITLIGPASRERSFAAVAIDAVTIAANVTVDAPGGWRLRWQVLAVDGHITRGDVWFRVRPA